VYLIIIFDRIHLLWAFNRNNYITFSSTNAKLVMSFRFNKISFLELSFIKRLSSHVNQFSLLFFVIYKRDFVYNFFVLVIFTCDAQFITHCSDEGFVYYSKRHYNQCCRSHSSLHENRIFLSCSHVSGII
jgi:hypothetical protein